MVKIIKKIINIVLIILIAFLSLYVLLRITNKVEIYKVETGSMEDKIFTGDYILILKQSDYEVNDIVTYKSNGFHITHRIIKENGNKVITKGDANNIEDKEISKNEVIGKVIISGGILNFVINYKYILVSIILIIYLVTVFYEKKKKKN